MAILTIRQKQRALAFIVGPLVAIGALLWFFVNVPWLAWPLLAAIVAGLVWLNARLNRRAKAKRDAEAQPSEEVPVMTDDTVDSLALRFIEVNAKLGRHVSVAEARAIAARELPKFKAQD